MIPKLLTWFKTYQKYLYGLLFIFGLFLLVFIKGCNYGKKRVQCPDIITNIVHVTDTIEHHIVDSFPYYIQGQEKIIYVEVPAKVDTDAILKDYFALHIYPDRKWENDSIYIHLSDTITRNKPIGNDFSYRLKFATMTINNTVDNSVHFNKYLYFGAGMPLYPFKAEGISNINYINLEGVYAFPRGYARGYWQPFNKEFGFSSGITIAKFKK